MQSCSCLSCRTWRHVHIVHASSACHPYIIRMSSSHARMSSAPGHVIRTLSAGNLHHSSWSLWAWTIFYCDRNLLLNGYWMCILSAVVLDIFLPNRQCQCHPYIISSTLYIFYHGEYVICTPSRWCVIRTPSRWRAICTPSGWHVICTAKKHVLPLWSLRSK